MDYLYKCEPNGVGTDALAHFLQKRKTSSVPKILMNKKTDSTTIDNLPINVAIADDQILFRLGLVTILNSLADIKVVCDVSNGKMLLEYLSSSTIAPSLILLDMVMPELDGMSTLAILKREYPMLPVLVLSSHDDHKTIFAALEAGANGYLTKSAPPVEVEEAICAVMRHGNYLKIPRSENGQQFMSLISPESATAGPQILLSGREKEILALVCFQYTSAEIARQLHLSERTVEGHRNNLIQKTNSKNTVGLIVYALKNKLISLSQLLQS